MKNLTLIVHEDAKQALADALRALPRIREFTFTPVESHGSQDERDTFLSARDRVAGYTPHVRMDLMLDDNDDLDAVLSALRDIAGRGVYWVTTVQKFGRL